LIVVSNRVSPPEPEGGGAQGVPIRNVHRFHSRAELAGIYRAAEVALVTPLRDGMNLVAKEYVAAQDEADPGVIVLSRFAGAARQMKDALIVNPFSQEDVADAMRRALAMTLPERRARWSALMQGLERDDIYAWRDTFVDALEAAKRQAGPGGGAIALRASA
jgi:trehalose 6-phosphate synthase